MTKLRESCARHDADAKSALKEAFEFRNTRAAVVLNDVNYWTFGELQEDIPEEYYGDDPRVMMDYQVKKIESHYSYYENDCYMAFLMPWYGTAVLASGFGHPIVKNYKSDPAADISRVRSPDEIRKLKLPDPRKDGMMPQVLRTLSYFREHTDLPVGVTDCQGPLTTALSLVGYDTYCYWMYDCPKILHGLMDLVTEALIRWVREQKEHARLPLDTESYPLGVRLPEGFGGVWLSDDDSVIMSTDLYRDFVMPYNSRVLEAFGGGCIHYCGNANQHIESFLATKGLTAINNFNLDDLKGAAAMRRAMAKKGIVYMACDFIPTEERMKDYYRELVDAMGDQKGLIIVPYVAPAVELQKGRYNESHRNQFELGKRVHALVEAAIAGAA
jgi:uroporphyrinogen-III decarboxylase